METFDDAEAWLRPRLRLGGRRDFSSRTDASTTVNANCRRTDQRLDIGDTLNRGCGLSRARSFQLIVQLGSQDRCAGGELKFRASRAASTFLR